MSCPEPTIERRYITRSEAAVYAAVTVRTIARWQASGRLRVTGSPVRTTREWVDEALSPKRVTRGDRTGG
jgi:hypothetical protein